MSAARGDRRVRTVVISGLVVALVAATAVAFFLYRGHDDVTTSNTNSTVVSDPTVTWQVYFYRAFNVSVAIPPGTYVCEDGENGFSVRNSGCGEDTTPSFTIRRNAAWDAMDEVTAFNDAYGQQLKEAGLESIGGHATLLGGKPVSLLRYNFLETFAGALATETLNVNAGAKKVAIDIDRDAPLHTTGTQYTDEELTVLFLTHLVLTTTTGSAKDATTSEWTVLDDTTAGFSISYPTRSIQYEPSSPAALAVTFGNQVRLEVRSGTTVDGTRGSLEGYRKLTEKELTVKGTAVNEERYILQDIPGSTQRLLFVPFTKGMRTVGVTFIFSGDAADEEKFETILSTFAFSGV